MSDVNSQNAIEGRTWQTEFAGARAGFVGAAGFASIAFGYPKRSFGENPNPPIAKKAEQKKERKVVS